MLLLDKARGRLRVTRAIIGQPAGSGRFNECDRFRKYVARRERERARARARATFLSPLLKRSHMSDKDLHAMRGVVQLEAGSSL